MTEYSDLDQVNALYAEQALIGQALTILDDFAGTVPSYVVAPTTGTPQNPPPMTVTINMADPPQAMLSGIRAGLVQRYNAINQELRDLGVTGTPPAAGPPLAETQPV